ncbi:MAG TPA: 6-phosphogluconolactonase [Rectinemataceae bacterium]|nr:6-phosphogluconolactonase [Rectinemataceae bacterium]
MAEALFSAKIDDLEVRVHRDRAAMGEAATEDAAAALRGAIAEKGSCRAVFAAAPSQNELLAGLVAARGIDWGRVAAFHMDEYVGLGAGSDARFSAFLRRRLFDLLPFGSVALLDPPLALASAEAARYATLLSAAPIDLVCLGIGENGHLAFNDPPADLDDPLAVRAVILDEACRRQQVNDGCFATLAAVPRRALTLTVPTLMSGARLVCVVPGRAKARAVRDALIGPINGSCPASALRRHPACVLHLDEDSAAEWLKERV